MRANAKRQARSDLAAYPLLPLTSRHQTSDTRAASSVFTAKAVCDPLRNSHFSRFFARRATRQKTRPTSAIRSSGIGIGLPTSTTVGGGLSGV
jgi:hypothetical protein